MKKKNKKWEELWYVSVPLSLQNEESLKVFLSSSDKDKLAMINSCLISSVKWDNGLIYDDANFIECSDVSQRLCTFLHN